jgi:hypothetical protein
VVKITTYIIEERVLVVSSQSIGGPYVKTVYLKTLSQLHRLLFNTHHTVAIIAVIVVLVIYVNFDLGPCLISRDKV